MRLRFLSFLFRGAVRSQNWSEGDETYRIELCVYIGGNSLLFFRGVFDPV